MSNLFIWLMLYTKIDNTSQTSNKDIKARYIKEYSQYKDSKRWLGLKIGQYLKDIYPNLITTGGGESPICYNIQLLPEPKEDLKRCTLNDLL